MNNAGRSHCQRSCVRAGNSASAITEDAGILVEWKNTGINFALASRNISSPDVGLNSTDKVPVEMFSLFRIIRPIFRI